jgi:hypothetical protein
MMATEAIRRLQVLVNEFGDQEFKVPDQLQPEWRNSVADIEFEDDKECITVVSD